MRCGATDHQIRDCPMMRIAEGQASAGNVSRAQSGHRFSRGGRVESRLPRASEVGGRAQPTAQARTYAVRA